MKKIAVTAMALALASVMSIGLIGCGSAEKSSSDAKSYNEMAEGVQKEKQAVKDEAEKAAGDASKGAGKVGEPITVSTDDGEFTIAIDGAYSVSKYSYAGDKGCAKIYYTINNISCKDSEIPLRELMVVTDNDGATATAEPDAKPSENPGKTSAPNGIPDCDEGSSDEFVTYYSVTKGAISIDIKVGGYSIDVPLEEVSE